jgi:hypothetical protein
MASGWLWRMGGQKKTLLIVRRAFKYVGGRYSSWNLTYLSRYSIGMELAPYFQLVENKRQQVVKASSGHFPQPFLIRDVVRTAAKVGVRFPYLQIFNAFFKRC